MKLITKIDAVKCPALMACLGLQFAEGREFAVKSGLFFAACTDGVWHVALNRDSKVEPYENHWSDADFGIGNK